MCCAHVGGGALLLCWVFLSLVYAIYSFTLVKGLLKKNAIGNEITVPLLQDIGTRDSL